MGELLVKKLNDYFDSEAKHVKYTRVLKCADTPFDSKLVDVPEIPPKNDVPDDLKDTILGKMAIAGAPALKGMVRKYWVRCAPPEEDAAAYLNVCKSVFQDIPDGYNNVAWIVDSGVMGLHFI